ncbi:MAG: FHA domain-containing protein, partial [Gammaproteobacteria bacterium]|nr:FHA domain-containing protein [Gammaproteobacteria bacterium]
MIGIYACQLFDFKRVMDILLFTIVKSPGAVALTETTKNISKDGASIGRGSVNTWVLPDPERYLSSVHTEIVYKNEKFYAIDQSTNGTFYNDSPEEIGKGNEAELHDGDRLIIGDYEIEVALWQDNNEELSSNGPFVASNELSAELDIPVAAVNVPIHDDLIPMNNSPLS